MPEKFCFICEDDTEHIHEHIEICSICSCICSNCLHSVQKNDAFENPDGTYECKECCACKFCSLRTINYKCMNDLCVYVCPACCEEKPTRDKSPYGGLFKNCCTECRSCEYCGKDKWDYVCICEI